MINSPGSAETLKENAEWRTRLASLIASKASHNEGCLLSADIVITPNEVNERHGTGVLIRRIFTDSSNILSIRSRNLYDAEHTFGAINLCLSYAGLSRSEVFASILRALKGTTARRIVCVPLYPDDVLSAIAIKELFNVPLCTYIMDDQNINSNFISDDLMRELLVKSSLRLAISSEMRDAYEQKYNLKFWLLPAVVPSRFLSSEASLTTDPAKSKIGVLIGNIWSQKWLDLLRQTVKQSELIIHWYGNNGSKWLNFDRQQLEDDGIIDCGFIEDENQLVAVLREYPYAIVPSSDLSQDDFHQVIARLSLPSRIPFILATSNTPLIVLGSARTAAARFVERFQIGTVSDYNSSNFREAVEQVCAPAAQTRMRQNAASKAESFSADGVLEWLWKSLKLGEPHDLKFEELISRLPSDLVTFIEPPVPKNVYVDFIHTYQALRRLKNQGFNPGFVLDIGASVGVWSHFMSQLFPDSRFILVDPLLSHYDEAIKNCYMGAHPQFELAEVAISDQPGKAFFQVSPDLYGSSLLHPSDFRTYETVEVEVTTVDKLAEQRMIEGQGLLKIDVQCAEHLVLEGAQSFLKQVDVIAIELSLVRYDARAKVFSEMFQAISNMGFRYYDDAGCWRSPVDGTLLQKDVLFLKQDLYLPELS